MDQIEVVENMSCDSLKKTDKIDNDTIMKSENVNLSSSPSVIDKKGASLCPITPFLNKESVNTTSKFISPSTVSSSMSIDDDILSTPLDNVFDSLAAVSGLNREKLIEKPESYVARKLNFNSGVKEPELASEIGFKDGIVSDSGVTEPVSDMGFKDDIVSESVYESILEDIVSKEAEDILAEIVAPDVLMTPLSVARLSGIADTCPGAPMKPARKLRNIDTRFCRKLEF